MSQCQDRSHSPSARNCVHACVHVRVYREGGQKGLSMVIACTPVSHICSSLKCMYCTCLKCLEEFVQHHC